MVCKLYLKTDVRGEKKDDVRHPLWHQPTISNSTGAPGLCALRYFTNLTGFQNQHFRNPGYVPVIVFRYTPLYNYYKKKFDLKWG